jgi:hypothetical protein
VAVPVALDHANPARRVVFAGDASYRPHGVHHETDDGSDSAQLGALDGTSWHRAYTRVAPDPERMPGLAISADALDPTRVNNFERWQSMEDLDAWRAVAHAPDTGITVRSDDVMMYVVSDVRPPLS